MRNRTILLLALAFAIAGVFTYKATVGSKREQLFTLIRQGKADEVRSLLKQKPDLLEVVFMGERKLGDTPLSVAVGIGQERVCEILIAEGANVNATNKSGAAIIHKAVKSGNTNLISLLVTNGANLNLKDRYGRTAFEIAKEMEFPQVIVQLVEPK